MMPLLAALMVKPTVTVTKITLPKMDYISALVSGLPLSPRVSELLARPLLQDPPPKPRTPIETFLAGEGEPNSPTIERPIPDHHQPMLRELKDSFTPSQFLLFEVFYNNMIGMRYRADLNDARLSYKGVCEVFVALTTLFPRSESSLSVQWINDQRIIVLHVGRCHHRLVWPAHTELAPSAPQT